MADIHALVTGRSFLEGPRWHDGALYVGSQNGVIVWIGSLSDWSRAIVGAEVRTAPKVA